MMSTSDRRISLTAVCVLLGTLLASTSATAQDWPQWRGPAGTGVSPESNLPVLWSTTTGIAWKAPLKGLGVSSPVVAAGRVFVSSQLGGPGGASPRQPTLSREQGDREFSLGSARDDQDSGPARFLVEAFSTEDGTRLWEFTLEAQTYPDGVHNKHNMASPSCVSDGQSVFCLFGTGQLTALSVGGEPLWTRSLAADYGPFDPSWGYASSPTLYGDTVIVLRDNDPESYLIALEKTSGRERWKVARGSGLTSHSTPQIFAIGDREELVVNSSKGLDAYAPATGEHLWSVRGDNRYPVPTPSAGDGRIFTTRGYRNGPYMSIRPGGSGDVTETHVLWRVPTGAPYVSSAVYYQGLMYMVHDSGRTMAVDGETGEIVWRHRAGGVHSASVVAGDGKVYLLNEDGKATVLRAGRRLEVLAINELQERCVASPAISGGRLYIRTDQHLVAVSGQ